MVALPPAPRSIASVTFVLFFLRTVLRALPESLNVIVFVLPAAIVSDLVASVFGFLARVRSRALPLHVVAAVQASLKLTLFFFSFSGCS